LAGGSATRNVDPLPTRLSTEISPPSDVTIAWAMESPRPDPCPTSLVVKNGSKIRLRVSGGMPGPVSRISATARPAASSMRLDDDLLGVDLPLSHRLRGVDEQVDEHLAELTLRRLDERGRAVLAAHAGVVPDDVLRDPDRALENLAQLEDRRLRLVDAAELLQIMDESVDPLTAFASVSERSP
jgi:hypothetical protein